MDNDVAGPEGFMDDVYSKRWWTLAVLTLSLVMVVVGNTVMNVALPTLSRELQASSSELQWIVDSYALVFAGLLLTAGAIGDRFGRKGALQVGLVIFGVASAVSAFATSPTQLIVTRAVMGFAAAFVMPATLSILTWVFPPHERGRAIGVWAGFVGAGAAIGPIAGGWLLEHFWWGSVFLLNVPIVLLALGAGRVLVPKSRDPEHMALDPAGAALSIIALSTLVYAVIEGPNYGWTDPLVVAPFVTATVFGLAFVLWEFRTDHPMLDLRMVRDRRFAFGSVAITFSFFAMFGVFFLLTQYLQVVLGYSPLEAGLRTLPMAVGLAVTAPTAARLVERFGTKRIVGTGLLTTSVGLTIASGLDASSGYPYLVFALVVMALGMGFTAAPSTASIMASMPLRKAGVGSAVNDTTRELGGALGVAVLGSIAISSYSSSIESAASNLPPGVVNTASRSVAAAVQISGELGASGVNLANAAKSAFTDAMSIAFLIGAAGAVVAAGLVYRFLPHHVVSVERPAGEAPDAPGAPEARPVQAEA
jgi:EmrB/QacA subfamily drug resistance transporter